MRNLGALFVRYKAVTVIFALLALTYVLTGLIAPISDASQAKYHVSEAQIRLLILTISLPYVLVWAVALIGYLRLRTYTEKLGLYSKDGQAFALITKGVFWFTFWLPASALLGAFGELIYRHHTGATAPVVRFLTYANILLLLPAFFYVYQGSKRLVSLTKNRVANPSHGVTIVFIAFSVLYTFLVLQDSARRIAPDAATPASYYLPDWLIIFSVVIPRLLCWFLGAQAVYNIWLYRRKVAGHIYRNALKYLSWGLAGIILIVILLRSLQSLNNPFSDLSLAVLFLVVYLLLIIMGISYLMVAKGAKQLIAIEES